MGKENNKWRLLDTGGHVYIAVRDMLLRTGAVAAVGVASDSVCVYGGPVDKDWGFLEKEAAWWPLNGPEDAAAFRAGSAAYFTPAQQEEVLKQWAAVRGG